MDVSVQEVDIPSEDGTPKKYFVRVDCRGPDLGSGFQVLLTDGELAWRGEVTDDGVHSEAEELEMPKEKYVQDLHQALTGTESSVTYNFTLTPQPTSTTSTSTTTTTTLVYEKVQKDISFRLGSVELGPVAEPGEAVRELLELGVQRASRLQGQNHHLQEENHTLMVEQKRITAELQRYAEGKQALEAELYSRFVLVLNHKKKKLRSLQQSLARLRQDSTRSSEKQSKATTSKEENSGDEYGGTTDEEKEEEEDDESRAEPAAVPATTTSASQEGDSDHLLDDEVNDITDVAPCRKRRIRNLATTSDPAAKRAPQRTTTTTTTTATARHKPDTPAGGTAAAADQQKASRRRQRPRKTATSPTAEDLFDDF